MLLCDPPATITVVGWIRPVYTHAPRKLKLHDISVQHRRLTFEPAAAVKKGSDDDARPSSSSSRSSKEALGGSLGTIPEAIRARGSSSKAVIVYLFDELHRRRDGVVGVGVGVAALRWPSRVFVVARSPRRSPIQPTQLFFFSPSSILLDSHDKVRLSHCGA